MAVYKRSVLLACAFAALMLVFGLLSFSGPSLAWSGKVIQKDVLPEMYTDLTMPGDVYQSLAYFPETYRVVFEADQGAVEVFIDEKKFDAVEKGQVYHRALRDRTLRPFIRVQPSSVPANKVILEGNTDADTGLPR